MLEDGRRHEVGTETVAGAPAADTPGADTPGADTPAADTPAADTPGAGAPGAGPSAADPPAAGPLAADPRPSGRGFLDQVSPSTISGWAVREDGEPAQVELWDGAKVIATVIADQPRSDLAEQGIAGGRGGFTVTTPSQLRDGRPHWIWATLAGSDVALRRSPLVLHAAGPASVGASSSREAGAASRPTDVSAPAARSA